MGRKPRYVAILGPRPDGIQTSWEELGSSSLPPTVVLTMTLATCLNSRSQAPTTSPPGGEGARRADEGDIFNDIKFFANRHLSHEIPGRPLIACRHFSPWGRSPSIHGRLLTASVKICDPRRAPSRESRSALEASATIDEVHLKCFIAQMNPASRHGRRGWGGGRAQRNRRKRRAHLAAFTAYRRPSAWCPLRRPCPATRRPSDRRSPGNPTSDPRRVR